MSSPSARRPVRAAIGALALAVLVGCGTPGASTELEPATDRGGSADPGRPSDSNRSSEPASRAAAARAEPDDARHDAPLDVLFVAFDDLRPELPVYGAAHAIAPNLERFARTALVFDRAYCQVASCGPSRASVLTGTRPDTSGVHDQTTHYRAVSPDVVALPQLFKEAGWTTRALGKVHHGTSVDELSWSVPWEHLASQVQRYGGTRARVRRAAFQVADEPDGVFHDGRLAELAIAALDELGGGDAPFWLGVGFVRPHLPFVAPRAYWELYDADALPVVIDAEPPRGAPDLALRGTTSELWSFDGVTAGAPVPADLARTRHHGYLAATSYSDAQFGRLLDALDRSGAADRTVVVVWSDHGFKLGEYGTWCKKTCFEVDARVPLMIRVPGSPSAGARTDAFVELVDLYPTLAEVCGLALPDHLEGTSFAPLFDDPSRPWKTAAFTQFRRSAFGREYDGRSIRTRDHRLTVWHEVGDASAVYAVELYDHRSDPGETVDLADDPAYAAVRSELEVRLAAGWSGALPPDDPARPR